MENKFRLLLKGGTVERFATAQERDAAAQAAADRTGAWVGLEEFTNKWLFVGKVDPSVEVSEELRRAEWNRRDGGSGRSLDGHPLREVLRHCGAEKP